MSSDRVRRPGSRSRRSGIVAIAKVLGVSPSTVSNAYNRPDQLSPALREQILKTAEAVGYAGPDPIARNLRKGRTGALGVVFSEPLPYPFDDPTAVTMLQGLAERAAVEQFALMFVPGSTDLPAHSNSIRGAAVDGFILHSLHDDDARLQLAIARPLPAVVIDSPRLTEVDFVGIDDRGAAATAMRHLLELGHRAVALLSFRLTGHGHVGIVDASERQGATAAVARERLAGCADAMSAAGLDWEDILIEECAASSVAAGREGARELLERAPATTAIFAFSDLLALGARQAALECGREIPADLSIVGFDGCAGEPEGLTTIYQPEHEKGRIAAERLLARLSRGTRRPECHILPTQLIVRRSTAPPREPTQSTR